MVTVLKLLLVSVLLQIASMETCTTESHTEQVRNRVTDEITHRTTYREKQHGMSRYYQIYSKQMVNLKHGIWIRYDSLH